MSRFDDRLSKELERAARPPEPADVFDEIDRRRERRVTVRRMQTAMLATVVFAGSIGGVLALNRAFRAEDGTTTPALPAAENRLIVISFGDDGGAHLYLQDPDDPAWDPRDHQLTDDLSSDVSPAVSPNGQTIAFERTPVDRSAPSGIWTVGIDGTDLRRISATDGGWSRQPTWAPDGDRLAFTTTGIDSTWLTVANADGSDAKMLEPGEAIGLGASDPAWSPDGSSIALAVHSGSNASSIVTIDVETGRERTLSPTFWDVGSPSWSPDGLQLAFAHGGGVVVLTMDGGDVAELTTTHTAEEAASSDLAFLDSQPAWSPDGEWIAFERSFSPSETFVYAIRPDGTDLHRVGLGGDPAWSVTPAEDAEPTDPVEPSETSSPVEQTPGRDIGLEFELCRLEALHGIDFLGNGVKGTAWVGARLTGDGSCPTEFESDGVVAVDVDGDGLAESWAGPLVQCLAGCAPFAATDLNGDGLQELVVTEAASSVMSYRLFSLQPVSGVGPPALQQVTVAEPGQLPSYRAGKPVALSSGGDEGYSASIRCEGYPTDPVIVVTTSDAPVEGPPSAMRTISEARLVFQADGTIAVVGWTTREELASSDSTYESFTDRACGVDFTPGY